MTQCYEFISIKILNENIQARPVAWDREIYDGFGNDRSGNQVTATEFQATCPFCGNLIHFSKKEIYLDSAGDDHIRCDTCKKGRKPGKQLEEAETVKAAPLKVEVKAKKTTFLDPIEAGLFDVEIDRELLEKVDLAESN